MSEKIFKRKIYERMLQWKQESDGQTALLIKGARRIGKSTIAEEFARREYDSYINIDFSIADAAVKELFSHISDLDYFFLRIQSLFNVSLHEENRLSFSMKCNCIHRPDKPSSTWLRTGGMTILKQGHFFPLKRM